MAQPIRPWNWCYRCHQPVDADDVYDGTEVTCFGCGRGFICVAYLDGSWSLDPINKRNSK